jgi:hypothetical protein
MIKDGDKVLVALSGGKDSLTLLHMLLQIKVRKREEEGGGRRREEEGGRGEQEGGGRGRKLQIKVRTVTRYSWP